MHAVVYLNGEQIKAVGRSSSWSLWLRWLLFTTLGGLLGLFAALGAPYTAWFLFHIDIDDGSKVSTYVLYLTITAIIWAVIGMMQLLLLRYYGVRASLWIASCAIGGTVYWLLFLTVNFLGRNISNISIEGNLVMAVLTCALGVVIGLCLGLAQWFVLARRTQRAGWWVLANVIGWAAALEIGNLSDALFHNGRESWNSVLRITMGLIIDPQSFEGQVKLIAQGSLMFVVYGVITGAALVRLFSQPAMTNEQHSTLRRSTGVASIVLGVLIAAYPAWTILSASSSDPLALWSRPPVYPNFTVDVWSGTDPGDRYLTFWTSTDKGRDQGEVITGIAYSETKDSPQSVLGFYADAFQKAGWSSRNTSPDVNTLRFVKFAGANASESQTYTFEVAAKDYSPYGTSVHLKLGVIKGR